ncbi:hypothetical protein JY651_37890 [Pyxidicoccus parkwayensis]|uniref:Uncharacterized protein n=1 Tax=Pyxidicoccus parkwayensis TaxID=2813578 RepID=A0ABX7NQ20_9BACT|nr:hypothetical protein [Pyxidicoccus parkwaysis]QSQ20951.1 hypothetical protein JY651_37890 [Pyxidicoccus parkwaysis]
MDGFTPGRSAPISPFSNDPRQRTPNEENYQKIYRPGSTRCNIFDVNGDGINELVFTVNYKSLMDIGTHHLTCRLYYSNPAFCNFSYGETAQTPCGWLCNASTATSIDYHVEFTATNLAPTASAAATPTSPSWSDKVQFKATAKDPDGQQGPVSLFYRWYVVSRPSNSTSIFSAPNISNPELQFTSDRDIGNWTFRLEVDDDEGELVTAPYQFTVPNVPPSFAVTGPSQVPTKQSIQLGVTATTDGDGGNLSFVWDIVSAPAGATPVPRNGYATTSSLSIPTTEKEIGPWRFRVTGKDNEGAELVREATVEVLNLKPRIEFAGGTTVDEGTPINLETTILTDDDGGDLSFQWEVVQAPARSGLTVPSVQSAFATLNIPANKAVPGTWIFRLTATDNEGASEKKEISVLVDGYPQVAYSRKPEVHVRGVGNLVLDASPSEDPDSPCPNEPSRCHLTDGRFATVSPGLVSYAWYISPAAGETPLRVQILFPHIADTGPVLTFGPEDLSKGEWFFELRIQDGEGNEETSQFSVDVQYPNTAPTPHVSVPGVRPTVLLSGLTLANIIVDGSASMDPDNTYDGTPASSGLGISNYEWVVTPPVGCSFPAPPNGPQAKSVLLFEAGTTVPAACQGRWTAQLTVTDDNPEPLKSVATLQFAIGNCAALACLDAPVPGNEKVLQEDDELGVLVALHLDSALYDDPVFALGTRVEMSIVASGSSTVVYSTTTPILTQQSRGQPIILNWNARDISGTRLSGTYDITLSVRTQAGTAPGVAQGQRVIVVENVTTQVLASGDLVIRRERLRDTSQRAEFHINIAGELPGVPIDSIRWRVMDEAGSTVATQTIPRGNSFPQLVRWDGRKSEGGELVPGGRYTFTAESMRNGVGLGPSAPLAFTLYSLEADPVVIAPGAVGTPADWVHLERAVPAVPVTAANFAQRRMRMSPLELRVTPLQPGGTVTLELENSPAGLVELFENGTSFKPITLPMQWDAATTPSLNARLLAYGLSAFGDVTFKLTYRVGGLVLDEERVRYRLGPSPAAVGVASALAPRFRVVRTVNDGQPILVALDPTRHRERAGRMANVYLVAHRDAAAWAADNTLLDVAAGPKPLTIGAANTPPTILELWGASHAGNYDVVYDFGNFADSPSAFRGDGKLDPGDLLDSPDGFAAVEVESSLLAPGPAAVSKVEYGGSYDVPLYTTHIEYGWDGVILPTGFDFPLRGLAVFPTVMTGKRPLVVFAHGNHLPQHVLSGAPPVPITVSSLMTSDENYRGYLYLQQHLASRGFITISVDLDATNGSGWLGYPALEGSDGIQARAWIVLKNIELLLKTPSAVPALAGAIDFSQIYLVGHSRGGEAVIVAEHQLRNLAVPGVIPPKESLVGLNASNIKGIVGLAPVSMAIESLYIQNHSSPFLLLYGNADGDVNGFTDGCHPFRHYDRAQRDSFAIRIEGANHNFFNTSWTTSDATHQLVSSTPGVLSLDLLKAIPLTPPVGDPSTLLSATQQRDIAKAYVTAFLMMLAQGDRGTREYFLQPPAKLSVSGLSPSPRLHTQARLRSLSGRTWVMDDFESNPAEAISSSGQAVTYSASPVKEAQLLDLDLGNETGIENRFFQDTNGVRFSWGGPATYEQELPSGKQDLRLANTINFRLAQPPITPSAPVAPLSLQVELEDATGRREALSLSAFDPVAPIYESVVWHPYKPYRIDGVVNPAARSKNATTAAFKTYRIPLAAFANTSVSLDMEHIVKVRFRMGGSGETPQGSLALDDLEIEF